MFQSITPLIALLTSGLLLQASHGGGLTITNQWAQNQGYTEILIGLLPSALYLGYILGTQISLRLIKRISYIRAYAVCGSLCAISSLILPMSNSIVITIISRFIFGIFLSLSMVIIDSWLTTVVEQKDKNRIYAIYMVFAYLGAGCGQLLLYVAESSPSLAFSWIAIIAIASILPVCMTKFKEPPVYAEIRSLSIIDNYRLAPLAMLSTFFAGMTLGVGSLIVVYGNHIGLDIGELTVMTAVFMLSGLVLQYPLGWISDRLGDRRKILLGVSMASCGVAGFLIFGELQAFLVLLFLIFLYGGSSNAIYPVALSHGTDFISREKLPQFCSKMFQVYALGACIGPIICGMLMSAISPEALFLYLALTCGIIACACISERLMPKVTPLETETIMPAMAAAGTIAPSSDMELHLGVTHPSQEIGPKAPFGNEDGDESKIN